MMKLLRAILFPIVPVYFLVTWLRNKLYDYGVKTSHSFDFPIICVGNLSTGGTGKSPMIEYLIRLLSKTHRVATLSRGYKRLTSGFILADTSANVAKIGDEPLQFYKKFNSLTVAVDEDRARGISLLQKLRPKPEVILLDDAYQHRKVNAGFYILLTAYQNLYCNDMVLPTGNLREPKSGANRANIIVVTKSPLDLNDNDKKKVMKKLNPKPNQSVFFSSIAYANYVLSAKDQIMLKDFDNFTLVTGIANATPLVDFLHYNNKSFKHLEFGDHYNYTIKDIDCLSKLPLILTTEKDYMRLSDFELLKPKLFYLSIKMTIDNAETFNELVLNNVGLL